MTGTVALVAGSVLGSSAFAQATTDPSFTARITSSQAITDESSQVKFGGSKSSDSKLTSERSNIDDEIDDTCTGTGLGSTTWSCTLGFDGAGPGMYNIQITEKNSDETVVQNELSFRIYDVDDEGQTTIPTAPAVSYVFTPGAVTVHAKAHGQFDDVVATNVIETQDDDEVLASCPSDSEGIHGDEPLGDNPPASLTCSADLGESQNANGNTAAGIYLITSQQGFAGDGISTDDQADAAVWVPHDSLADDAGAPLAFTTNTTDRTVTITGSVDHYTWDDGGLNLGQPGGSVDILDSDNHVLCSTNTYTVINQTDFAKFSCTTSALSYGTHTLRAAVVDDGMLDGEEAYGELADYGTDGGAYITGAMSAASKVGTVDFPEPVVVPLATAMPTATPTPTAIPILFSFTINGVDPNNMAAGDKFTIDGTGLPSGTVIDAEIHSKPESLGSTSVKSDGTFSLHATVPNDIIKGAHEIIVNAVGAGVSSAPVQQGVTVIPKPAKKTTPTPTNYVDPLTRAATAPNVLTKGLSSIADVLAHPAKIAAAVEIGLVLLLLAALPAHLLESTIAEQSERFERRFRNRPKQPRWLLDLVAWFRRTPIGGGILVTVLTAVLFGFADPKFGITLASVRLILAAGIALFLVGFVANSVTRAIARAAWQIEAEIRTRPWGLILTVVGVVFSRVLHFAPGFLIGLILGLAIEGRAAKAAAWRLVVLRASIVLVMGIAAWIGYSFLTSNGTEGGTFWSELLIETLVAITTEGVVALLIELLPLRFLEGQRIYARSRVLWGAFYVFNVIVFVLAVIPWEGNWSALGSALWIWIVILAIFAALCVGVYVYFRRFAKPLEAEAGSEEVPLGETVSGDNS